MSTLVNEALETEKVHQSAAREIHRSGDIAIGDVRLMESSEGRHLWPLLDLLDGVHSNCDWLHRLSNLIRKASVSSQNQRADRFMWRDANGVKSEGITRETVCGLEKLFTYLVTRDLTDRSNDSARQVPSIDAEDRQQRLIKRIVKAMIIRHKRVLYRRSRQISYDIPQMRRNVQSTPQGLDRPTIQVSKTVSDDPTHPTPNEEMSHASVRPPDKATTINVSSLRRITSPSYLSHGTASVYQGQGHLEIPPPPRAAQNGNEFVCPYCCLLIRDDIGRRSTAWT